MVEAAEVLAAMWANPIQGPLPSRSDLIRPHPRRTGHLLRPRMPARSSRSSRASPCPPTRAERIGRRVGRSDRPSRDFCRDETERLDKFLEVAHVTASRARERGGPTPSTQGAKKRRREQGTMLPTSSRLHNTGVFCLRSPLTGNGSPHTHTGHVSYCTPAKRPPRCAADTPYSAARQAQPVNAPSGDSRCGAPIRRCCRAAGQSSAGVNQPSRLHNPAERRNHAMVSSQALLCLP